VNVAPRSVSRLASASTPLHAGGERDRAVGRAGAAADVDVEVKAVLDHLGLRHHVEPDPGTFTAGIDDAVRADSQLSVGKPDIAPPVVPGSEPCGGRFKHVSQSSRPEAGERLGILAVDDELESGRHRAPIGSAVARASASMPLMPPALPCPMAAARLEPERMQLPACSAQRRRTDRLYRQRHDLHDVTRAPYPAGQAPHNPYRARSLAVSVSMAPERAPSPTRHAPRPGVPDRAAAKPP